MNQQHLIQERKEHNEKCYSCRNLIAENGKVCCRWCCKEKHQHIFCTDSSRCHCPCHEETKSKDSLQAESKHKPNWEIEFDKKFVFVDHDGTKIVGLYSEESKVIEYWQDYKIKNFIKALVASAKREVIEEVEEKIKELGHQQDDDTIWCNMDEILKVLLSLKDKLDTTS